MKVVHIPGFLAAPKKTPSGSIYQGRYTCHDVQWTGEPPEVATFTASAEQIADAAANNILWTDQNVQRGIQPEVSPRPPRELSLGNGYPDPKKYVFSTENTDDMVEKLLRGDKLFMNPLVWNLRPGNFNAYWDSASSSIFLYDGKVYLPDSHHRHQAIQKAVTLWRDSPTAYPNFNGSKQFKVELYFLTAEDEGNYFFDKNQRPKPTAKSKAYDLTTQDDLSLLAKRFIDSSSALKDNINRVTDRLKNGTFQVATLSTIREMMRTFANSDALDSAELEGLAKVGARFFDLLAAVRPELGVLSASARRIVRTESLVDSAVMMHGYAALMADYNSSVGKEGAAQADKTWSKKLDRLAKRHPYTFRKWKGDLFDRSNPLWSSRGVTKAKGDKQELSVLNTGGARAQCGKILRAILAPPSIEYDLHALLKRIE